MWTPGLSLVISLLIKIGIDIKFAIIIVKISFLIIGISFWSKVLFKQINDKLLKVFLLACFLYLLISIASTTSDLIIFALFPLLLEIISKYFFCNNERKENNFIKYIIAGTITTFMILIKYQSLMFIIFGSIIIILNNYKNFKQLLIKWLLFSAIPITTYVIVLIINHTNSNSNDTLIKFSQFEYSFNILWIIELIRNVLLKPLFFDAFFSNLIRVFHLNSFSEFISIVITLIFSIIIIYLLFVKKSTNKSYIKIKNIYLIALISNMVFLFLVTTLLNKHNDSWTYLTELRYYYFLLPLYFYLIISYIESLNITIFKSIKVAVFILSIFVILGLFSYQAYRRNIAFRSYNVCKEKVINNINNIKKNYHTQNSIAVASNTYFKMLLWKDYMPAFRYAENFFNDSVYFSKPTLIFIVTSNLTNYNFKQSIIGCNNMKTLSKRLKTDSIIVDSTIIYYRQFEKGKLLDII